MFSNLVTKGSGAALSIKSQSAAIIQNSTFYFNESKSSGGSIFFSEAMGFISDCTFWNNWGLRGHSIDSTSNSFLWISKSNFINNGYLFTFNNGRLPRACPKSGYDDELWIFHPSDK